MELIRKILGCYFILVILFACLIGCGAAQQPAEPQINSAATTPASPNSAADGWMTPQQKLRAEQITSLFENDTIELQYGYAENINDGRGITSGRAGFTTATGDAYAVVQLYTDKSPDNALAKYLPRLKELAESGSDSTSGLNDGYSSTWANEAKNPAFRAAQDEIVDREYYRPAMQTGDQIGLKTALARACLYDTIIQHGGGEDHDGLPALIQRTHQAAGGSPSDGIDEAPWLKAFLKTRRATLENATDPATRQAWAESTYRVDVLESILAQGNFDLHGPIPIKVAWFDVTIP